MRFLSIVVLGAAAVVSPAFAATPPVPGTRALGLAGALRGAATGDSALTLNPSGMSLMRAYVIEGAYAYDHIGNGTSNLGRISIVDSTSGFNVAGGIYYNYLDDETVVPHRSGHEGGVALSVPFGEHLFLGAMGKYFRLSNNGTLPAGVPSRVSGLTMDVGLTIKPASAISLGLVGQNLIDLHTDRAPRTFGGGIALGATPDLLFTFDAAYDVSHSSHKVWNFMGGGEYLVMKRFGLRAGGGHRGNTKAGYLAAGASLIAPYGALDFGFEQDLGGLPKETFIGASARLFLPAPE
jgi:hypothetical protein